MSCKIRVFKNHDSDGKPVEYVMIIRTYPSRLRLFRRPKTQVITGATLNELRVKSSLYLKDGLLNNAVIHLRPAYDLRYLNGKKLKPAPLSKDETNAIFH